MAGILSSGIKISMATYSGGTLGAYAEIANLQSIPSLGGDVEKVDVTCLGDASRKYINGIKDYGDLEFKFLYDNSAATSNYRVLKAAESQAKVSLQVELPDALSGTGTHHGTQFTFDAQISVALDEAEVNGALTFTMSASLQSDIAITDCN